jgi:hypothetical protein
MLQAGSCPPGRPNLSFGGSYESYVQVPVVAETMDSREEVIFPFGPEPAGPHHLGTSQKQEGGGVEVSLFTGRWHTKC